jgi:hypothetical protein
MRAFNRLHKTTDWIRFALKFGLLVTDAKVWSAVDHLLSQRPDERVAVQSRYDDAIRPRHVRELPRHRNSFLSRASTVFGAIGIGVGLGMLLAPVSGEEARAAIRDKAIDIKNKVRDAAVWTSGCSSSTTNRRSTGTYGY